MAPGDGENEFLKLLAVDFSSLEPRFERIVARLEALERRLARQEQLAASAHTDDPSAFAPAVAAAAEEPRGGGDGESWHAAPVTQDPQTTATTRDAGEGEGEGPRHAEDEEAEAASEPPAAEASARPRPKAYHDALALAREIESLRAAQLRLQVEHELAHSSLAVELGALREEVALRPQRADLAAFRAEVAHTAAERARELRGECEALAHAASATLAARQLAENRWKAAFEASLAARIQDLWSGLHAASRKLQEGLQLAHTDAVTQEEAAKEVAAALEAVRAQTQRVEQASRAQTQQLGEQEKDLVHVHGLCAQAAARLDEQEAKVQGQVGSIYRQLARADARATQQQQQQDALAQATDKRLAAVAAELRSSHSSVRAQQDALRSLDAASTRQQAELTRLADGATTAEARAGGLDGRLGAAEKKLVATEAAVETHAQERQRLAAALQEAVNHAALDRGAMKRSAADVALSLQDAQQGVRDVAQQAATTELALARTAAELAKLQALAGATSSNVAKNRQSVRDVLAMVEQDREAARALRRALDAEAARSETRFASAQQRHEDAQRALADAQRASTSASQALEARLGHHGNVLHQLHAAVDGLVVAESAQAMEDKLGVLALACAQLTLKLERCGRDTQRPVRADVQAELAVLLARAIRFLGAGVAVDQNAFLLSASRAQGVDAASGQAARVRPPQRVLEGFRHAKAALFTARTRAAMDELQPVARANRAAVAVREALERRLRFVLDFGLANLFPNQGRPAPPDGRHGAHLGTCIACDRPIDPHEPPPDDDDARCERCEPCEPCEAARPASAGPSGRTSADKRRESGRPGSAAVGTRIDTQSAVRGRSGASRLPRKASNEAIHCAPGRGAVVYRGGFRLPKAAATTPRAVVASTASCPAGLHAGEDAAAMAEAEAASPERSGSGGLLDPQASRLEKVALRGRCQPVEVPTMGPRGAAAPASDASRPHAAPVRANSLPRLELSVSLGVEGDGPSHAAAARPTARPTAPP